MVPCFLHSLAVLFLFKIQGGNAMNDEILDVYTRDGEHLGTKTRSFCHNITDTVNPSCYHKTVWIWIINNKGQILVQKRSKYKKRQPNLWDMPSAGHIDAGEDQLIAAVRETKEELGLVTAKEEYIFLGEYIADYAYELAQLYLLKTDKNISDMVLNPEEVAEVKWLSLEEFQGLLYSDQFVPHTKDYKDLVIKLLKQYIKEELE